MKGKIAFVLGAAVGYVLGTRAGRERYEQIKNGAQNLWQTAPVQRGVGVVRDAAQTRIDELKASATRAGKNAVAAFFRDDETAARPASSTASAKPVADAASGGQKDSGGSGTSNGSDASKKKASSGTAKSNSAAKSAGTAKSSQASTGSKKRSSGAAAKSGGEA
ncbi:MULTISPECIES: YtxH domain-containing protein [unclassified Leucobacter]|uniref:YtxH domain-containing protein n=1 Tax=unclassified Leucobacter TaxID=2621730 RepID=UPI003018FB2C